MTFPCFACRLKMGAPRGDHWSKLHAGQAVSLEEPTITAVNKLCTALGLVIVSTETVDGSGFAHAKTARVALSGKTKTTALTDSTGAFQATFTDPSQPYGSYTVSAKTGAKEASTTMGSGASGCFVATSKGKKTLKWHVQGVGFDARTEADLLVNGAVFESFTTNAKGAFNKHFRVGCPGSGDFTVSFQGSFGGTVGQFGNGTLDCP